MRTEHIFDKRLARSFSWMDSVLHNPAVINYTLEKTFARKSVRSRIKSHTPRIVEFACKQDLGICPMVRKI